MGAAGEHREGATSQLTRELLPFLQREVQGHWPVGTIWERVGQKDDGPLQSDTGIWSSASILSLWTSKLKFSSSFPEADRLRSVAPDSGWGRTPQETGCEEGGGWGG